MKYTQSKKIKLFSLVIVACFFAHAFSAQAKEQQSTAPLAQSASKSAELTVEGKIKKVVSKKNEIYVIPNDGSKKMEFYFPENAQYFKNGQSVGFEMLQEGQKVRVTFTRTGKRLNPTKAEILE